MKYIATLLFSALLVMPFLSQAQRSSNSTSYLSLLQRSDQPSSYITDVVVPGENGATAGVMFRLDYDLVPFLKVRQATDAPDGAEYFAPIRIGLEIFEGTHREGRRNSNNARSVFRDNYTDTVYVNSFEQTRSRLQHVQGVLSTTLDPGDYNYELQLTRAQSTREQSSTRQNLSVPQPDTLSSAAITLLSDFNQDENRATGTYLNYGENVLYGSDFDMFVMLPGDSDETNYTITMHQLSGGELDQADSEPVFETTLEADEIFNGQNIAFENTDSGVQFSMNTGTGNNRFGVVSVPNSEFENARYRIRIFNAAGDRVSQKIVNSRWLDMPVSLLNIDVAIDMMKYIVNEDELDRLRSGSSAEKERKFREFWDERDPTPDTEFNELMTEYYERVDYAFRNFSSLQTPGYDTDQGEAYILYGAPENVERRFPTDEPTREIWEYPNRTLVFEATTGFGDFRLISEQ